jgi:hypothetical protein
MGLFDWLGKGLQFGGLIADMIPGGAAVGIPMGAAGGLVGGLGGNKGGGGGAGATMPSIVSSGGEKTGTSQALSTLATLLNTKNQQQGQGQGLVPGGITQPGSQPYTSYSAAGNPYTVPGTTPLSNTGGGS